ncbi:MAG: RNA polymerase sigma factor [Bradymonadaceae bacterium]
MIAAKQKSPAHSARGDAHLSDSSKPMTQAAYDTQPQFDTESQWILRAARGDVASFRRLYDRYVDYVTHNVGRLMGPGSDLEDVVQEVFVQVYRSLDGFRHESAFSTWLYRIARNVAIDHLRKRSKTVELADWRPLRCSTELWAKLEAREQVRALYAAMQKFSIENREAFILHELEGMKLREIEELTGESINTIAARVRRTREQLRVILEAAQGAETL